jgi:prepilin signal peptidase PulO-like enzyme (type II secretory pathway)
LALIILASLIGIIYASIRNVFGKRRKQTGKSLFTQRQSTNKIIPFIPALILAFWILLYKANILNSSFNYTGIGVINGSKYGKIYVQMFIGK